MKPQLSLLLLFLMGLPTAFSQEDARASQNGASSYITFSPLSALDAYAPRWRVGYVQPISSHWQVGVDLGYGNKGMALVSGNIGDAYRLCEIRPEVRYVLNPRARTIKYLSAELFYIDQANVFSNGDYEAENGDDFTYDRANYQRQKYGMHLKFGLFVDLGKRAGFNFYGGIGFRWRQSDYFDVENREGADIFREWYPSMYDREGHAFGPNPTLGAAFYYRL
ncbi:hypothetical protein [Pseudozobellia thermophila]|uniref:Outer membrane protein beta-barrel domain-containing protein n=1 Tax=Pseudozobellia thermophila TaxID=192903 RepID=A0A1M6AJS3_9FLAO|nr:hypothetical protein [Pseudozobellia thermophila]SHI36588.1 hypothetical protein SAMN04488513_10179 [Pseudozobellia thermophila]